jgi:hypothetical protein
MINGGIMSYQFPVIELTDFQNIWLTEIYKRFVQQDDLDVRVIRVALLDKLPRDFNPDEIDARLVIGTNLTLLGIWHVDPDNLIFENTESVILAVRQEIIKNPKLKEVTSKHISNLTEIPESNVVQIFSFLSSIGHFYSSGALGTRKDETEWYNIDVSEVRVLEEYLKYESLENQIQLHFSQSESVKGVDNSFFGNVSEIDKIERVNPNTAFILMRIDPSNPELVNISNAIKAVCGNFGIMAVCADDIEHQEQITNVVLREIRRAEFLIADLTGERPNVYYEVGYAHAINKRPVLIRKSGTKLHFDLSVHNVPEYQNITELITLLSKRFEAITGNAPKIIDL